MIPGTTVKVQGIELDHVGSLELTLTRGVAWSTVRFAVVEDGDADRALAKLANPVTIRFECAAADETATDTLTLKKWYIMSRRKREAGLVEYELADVRWDICQRKFTRSFNIRSYGGLYRAHTLRGRTVPFKAREAIEEIYRECGAAIATDKDLDAAVNTITLPDNLGNVEGGGFVGADILEHVPAMCELIACDPVVTEDGAIMLTDRVSDTHSKLEKFMRFAGGADVGDNSWQLPSEIRVPFQKRIERLAQYGEGAATSASNGVDIELENVIPNWTPGASITVTDHTELTAYVASYFIARALILKRWFRPTMFDIHGNFTAEVLDRYNVIEDQVRQCFRQRFRFKLPRPGNVLTDETRARYASLAFGRIQVDGTTRKDGVFLDYVRELRFGKLKNKGDHPLTAVFTENIAIASQNKPAPFDIGWVDRDNLIFQLAAQRPDSRATRGYFPGRMARDRAYTDFHAAVNGTGKFELDVNNELASAFRMHLFWTGLWVYHGTGDQARDYTVKLPAFSGGKAGVLTARVVQDITANYQYDATFPGKLLNESALKARAKEVVDEIKRSLAEGPAGIAHHAGLEVMTKGKAWPRGSVHEVAIIVGGRAPGSLETRITVLPGARAQEERTFTHDRARGEKAERIL